MMTTTKQLIETCERLGYNISKRKITDWIQKGLIPPRNERGQGRGKGKLYYWDEPYIIPQTIAIEEFMRWHSQSEHVLLMLWFNGFSIDAGRVRDPWLKELRKRTERLYNLYPDSFDLEEKIDRKLQRSAKRSTNGPENVAAMTIMGIISKITMSNGFDLMDALEQTNLEELLKPVIEEKSDSNAIPMISSILVNCLQNLQKYFSPDNPIQLIESVSDKELKQAQDDWGILLRFLEPILRALLPGDIYAWPNVKSARLWWRIITHLGGNVIIMNLALRREGFFSSKIEKTVSILQNDSNRLALIQEIRHLHRMETPTQQGTFFSWFTSSLEDIWRN